MARVGSVLRGGATWGIAGVKVPEATARKVGNPQVKKCLKQPRGRSEIHKLKIDKSPTLTDTGTSSKATGEAENPRREPSARAGQMTPQSASCSMLDPITRLQGSGGVRA
ncbi:hypothetical protein V498_06529 [Pseudogymnoascus sp. VKM F-4517 (FW-2822)]|nr:hypothetical protein V498_06529 [Pseudogymnoascus sp. VKM F-4517 (FW-2822)]